MEPKLKANHPWESVWTTISNFKGYVTSVEEANRVRDLFEIETAIKYNVESPKKASFGLTLGSLVNVVSKSNPTSSLKPNVANDIELEPPVLLDGSEERQHQQTPDAELPSSSGLPHQRIRFEDIAGDIVPSDGVPFVSSFKRTYSCMFGRNKHAIQKRRNEIEKEKELKKDHPLPLKRRYRMLQPSRKKGCPAAIEMKEVIRFPDFKIAPDATTWKRKYVSAKIRDALSKGEGLQTEKRIYIKLPFSEDHQCHDVGKMTGFLKPIDKRLSQRLTELVRHGVSSVQEMKRHLRIHVETVLYPDPEIRPQGTDTAFYPTDEVLASRIYAAKMHLRIPRKRTSQ